MAKLHIFAHTAKQVAPFPVPAEVTFLQHRLTQLQQAESIAHLLFDWHDDPVMEQKLYEIQAARLTVIQQLQDVAEAC